MRVSTLDQNESRQLDGVQLDRRFIDKASCKDTKRPQLQAALDYVRDGDVLVVHSMDRIARNLDDLRRIVMELTGRGVVVASVITLNPAIHYQFKTGQRDWPKT